MKKFKEQLGLRTVKTVICATVAILIASFFKLDFALSAGIIAILSVTNTTKTTFIAARNRLLSLVIALSIASILFLSLGFQILVFGLFLLLFIPISNRLKISDGIVINSVIVTHLLSNRQINLPILMNECELMVIGVGLALIANLFMPSVEKKLEENQQIIETLMKKIASSIAEKLNQQENERLLYQQCSGLIEFVEESIEIARQHKENKLFEKSDFFFEYFQMRLVQIRLLSEILERLTQLTVSSDQLHEVAKIFENLSITLHTENNGEELLQQIQDTYQNYRQMPLPSTRDEFENRAMLFQVLQLIEVMIQTKNDFSKKV